MPYPQPYFGAPPALLQRLERKQRLEGKLVGAAARVARPRKSASEWGEGAGREYEGGECVVKMCNKCNRMVKMRAEDMYNIFTCPFCKFMMWQSMSHSMVSASVPREGGDAKVIIEGNRNRYSEAVSMQQSKVSRQPSVRTNLGRQHSRSPLSCTFASTPVVSPVEYDDSTSETSFCTVSGITTLRTPSVRHDMQPPLHPRTPTADLKRSVSFRDAPPPAEDLPLISNTPFEITLSPPTKFSVAPKSFFEINRQLQI